MAVQKPTIPKGTRDFGPAEVQKRKYILNTIETVFKKYGFMPIETPTMENLSTLEGKYGDEGDKLLFRVTDSGDYISKLKLDLVPKLTNQTREFFDSTIEHFARSILKVFKWGDYANIPLINKHINDQLGSCINLYGFEFTQKQIEIVKNYFVKESGILATEIAKMFVFSGISNESELEDIDWQIRNLKKNILDKLTEKLTQDLIPRFEEVSEEFNRLSSTDFNRETSEKGLRYDLTVPFARYVVMNKNEIAFPFKRYQMQPVWRADRPQKGRYREFWQCDADMVGSDSLLNELDLIQIYDEAFRNLRIENYELRINNRKILAGIAEVVKSIDQMSTIAVAIDKLDKIGEEGVRKELTEQGFSDDELNRLFDIISIKGENTTILTQLKSKLQSSTEGLTGIEELEFILSALNLSTNNTINLKLDFSLARGLSYYTGCIFEVVSTEGSLKSSIGGGGRYDNLTGIFGLPNVSGVGISFGLDRIYDVIEELKLFPEDLNATSTKILICAFEKETQLNALGILKKLRDTQISSELYPELPKSKKEVENPLQKPMNYADALKIPFRLILKDNSMMLKDIQGNVIPVSNVEELIEKIKN